MAKEFAQWSVKYRPSTIDDFIENNTALSQAKNIVSKKNSHAILIHGESGCGKTTLARIIANGLTDKESDIVEKNMSSDGGIGDVRSLITASQYKPIGAFKVFILDEVHSLKGPAQAAILKTVEEPEHEKVVWILCTNKPMMLDSALINRMRRIEVKKPSEKGLAVHLYKVSKKEKLFESFKKKQVQKICLEIARASDLVPREAMQLLQEVSDTEEEFDSFKDLVIEGIRKRAESGIDKVALQVLMFFYSPEKSAQEKAGFLVNNLADKDLWALTQRLCDIHTHLMNHVAGVRGGPSFYYAKELEPRKAVPNNLQVMGVVGARLVEIRNSMINLNASLNHLVIPALVNILFECDKIMSKQK